jgi:hypothetical protein
MGMSIRAALLCALILLAGAGPLAASEQEPLQDPALKTLYLELGALFRQYYPNATGYLLKDKLHFEYNTRAFLIHLPNRTGAWQDPAEERGPDRGGILCDLELRKGRYEGAAVVPQTFDQRYFKVLLMAPYSPKRDANLYTRLSYPDGVNPAFLARFTELVNEFIAQAKVDARWLDAGSTRPSRLPDSRWLAPMRAGVAAL